ncbi:MAG TPA: hypothetical protein VNG51_19300 [Ktedonobacteraceae bacterium]|nr:hypothetical protein [Ktedonobacteraceae bacterium]
MRPNTKSSRRYLVVLALLFLYVLSLIAAAFLFHVDTVWVFYGLIPSACSIYLALHGYHESQHAENHLRRIANDMAAVKAYVESLVGVGKEFDS